MPSAGNASMSSVLFQSSHRLTVLDQFGIPYELAGSDEGSGIASLRRGNGAALLWPARSPHHGPPVVASLETAGGARIPIFGAVTPDRTAGTLLTEHGGSWDRTGRVFGLDGEQVASIWRSEDGSVFLPFDPDEVRLNYLSERYQTIARGPGARDWRRLARLGYYRVRGLMPRPVQIWLRRRYARVQAHSEFPRWPIEAGLHDFFEMLLSLLESVAEEPVPRIAAWPEGFSWALVSTHDVETAAGLAAMEPVLELERSLGFRSSWNFVPRRYGVDPDHLRALVAAGFEVGVHGLYHDGRDLESPAMLRERLPGMRQAAARWGAVGFRSPATHRDWALMPLLGFDYDSSYPDTDPFEPQGGGCCTWLPFFNRDTVELPLTMPQDHTLFVILRHADETAWVQKAEFLRSRGGMALLDTHPDYLIDEQIFGAYRRFLERFESDEDAWRALPRDVSGWWRRRAQSRLERRAGRWIVTGPAAEEARVEFTSNGASLPDHA
jgi:hypothetical protein